MKIDDAMKIAKDTARAVLEDMVREARGPVNFGSMMVCYRGVDPVAMLVCPPNRDVILQTAFLAIRGFGPDLAAITHDTYIATGKAGDELIDPRTGKEWATPTPDAPGPMQTYVEEFGYDGTIADALVTHAVNRAGDARVVPEPYVVDGRWVRWLDMGQDHDEALYRDEGVRHALVRMMGMPTLAQVMPNVIPAWAQKMAAAKPEVARWSYDMAVVTAIEEAVDSPVAVSLFAEKGSPRDQLFKSRFPKSQVIDPRRWN